MRSAQGAWPIRASSLTPPLSSAQRRLPSLPLAGGLSLQRLPLAWPSWDWLTYMASLGCPFSYWWPHPNEGFQLVEGKQAIKPTICKHYHI